eukprot:TRINITY_DN5188_c0_g1_i1.p1 TRINITY_DN5188_c0_g1~~TRINITY_DN5188_c0_g1_i1.p1  ORF type:complete len:748 (+),score=148.13 TRINITY_DN5188_c0_g1_i1:120-2363(+)
MQAGYELAGSALNTSIIDYSSAGSDAEHSGKEGANDAGGTQIGHDCHDGALAGHGFGRRFFRKATLAVVALGIVGVVIWTATSPSPIHSEEMPDWTISRADDEMFQGKFVQNPNCDVKCHVGGSHHSCRQRVNYIRRKTASLKDAITLVDSECEGQCSCAPEAVCDEATTPGGCPLGWHPTDQTKGGDFTWCEVGIPREDWKPLKACPTGTSSTRVKVLTFNLFWWMLFKRQGGGGALRLLAHSSFDEAYDFLVFQECDDIHGLLAKAKQHGMHEDFSVESLVLGNRAIAMAYRKSIWSVLTTGQEDVGEDDKKQYYGKRSVQWARLQHRKNGMVVFLVNHHGPLPVSYGGGCTGSACAYNILRVISQNAHAGDNIILAGDFNAKPTSTRVQALDHYLHRVYSGTTHGSVDHVYSNCNGARIKEVKNYGSGRSYDNHGAAHGSDHDALSVIFEFQHASQDFVNNLKASVGGPGGVDTWSGVESVDEEDDVTHKTGGCNDKCTVHGSSYSCASRIRWDAKNSPPKDINFAMKKINDECEGQCKCTDLDGHTFDADALDHIKANDNCQKPCKLFGVSHSCEDRIIWDKKNTPPYHWDHAIWKVNGECEGQCECVKVGDHVYNEEFRKELEAPGCEDKCNHAGYDFSCHERILYDHDKRKLEWEAAIAKVNRECKGECHCDEMRGHVVDMEKTEAVTKQTKNCDDKCYFGGTHHTCKQRVDWTAKHRYPYKETAAKKQVNEECTGQCFCH